MKKYVRVGTCTTNSVCQPDLNNIVSNNAFDECVLFTPALISDCIRCSRNSLFATSNSAETSTRPRERHAMMSSSSEQRPCRCATERNDKPE